MTTSWRAGMAVPTGLSIVFLMEILATFLAPWKRLMCEELLPSAPAVGW